MLYKVLRGCSVRLSPKVGEPDYERFQDWLPGETLDTDAAPAHLDVDGLIALGVITAIDAPLTKGGRPAPGPQDAQEPSQQAGAVLTDAGGTATALREIDGLIQTVEGGLEHDEK